MSDDAPPPKVQLTPESERKLKEAFSAITLQMVEENMEIQVQPASFGRISISIGVHFTANFTVNIG